MARLEAHLVGHDGNPVEEENVGLSELVKNPEASQPDFPTGPACSFDSLAPARLRTAATLGPAKERARRSRCLLSRRGLDGFGRRHAALASLDSFLRLVFEGRYTHFGIIRGYFRCSRNLLRGSLRGLRLASRDAVYAFGFASFGLSEPPCRSGIRGAAEPFGDGQQYRASRMP